MTRYKMIGRDVDSSPIEYRTWITDGYPDYDGYYYTGLKGGTNPLVDIIPFTVTDDSLILDFNMPNPLSWKTTYETLPQPTYNSHLAIIDGYVYLFGGQLTNKIYRAPLGYPTGFRDTKATLPTALYGAQLAIVDGYVYLFGGNNGAATNTIYSAPVSDPLTWTNHGSLLPTALYFSSLFIQDGYIYLVGGKETNDPVSTVLVASTSDPLTWQTSSYSLPFAIYGSQIALVNGYAYLFGGIINNQPTLTIHRARMSTATNWAAAGVLPYASAFSQFVTIGDKGYLFTYDIEYSSPTYNTKIFRCDLRNPLVWAKMTQTIPGEIYQSQLAVIYDRIFLFGGNGNTTIWASNQSIKYSFTSVDTYNYGNVTRTLYQATADQLDLMGVIGFPYWKTDYFWE